MIEDTDSQSEDESQDSDDSRHSEDYQSEDSDDNQDSESGQSSKPSDNPFYCSACSRQFENLFFLNHHFIFNSKPSACQFCKQNFKNQCEYRTHNCVYAVWCDTCVDFHARENNQPTMPLNNSSLQIQDQEGDKDMACVNCKSNMRSRLFLPCAHVVCCWKCSLIVFGCPICNCEITKVKAVILS
jgi:hypothetical protein